MRAREFRIIVALALASGLLALVITAFLVVPTPSISHASHLNQVGNPCDGVQINIIPPLPTLNDTISVTYSAEWSDSCAPSIENKLAQKGSMRYPSVQI